MTPKALRAAEHRDAGRLVARVLCAIFAVVGALPLMGGLLVGSPAVQEWAARETTRVLEEQLGLRAAYQVHMQLWPLRVAMEEISVPSTDGGPPALTADSISISPRVFSLLAGRLDVGDIEIESPRARLVMEGGSIKNVRYRLPKTDAEATSLQRAPFSSLAVNDARLELSIDGVRLVTSSADIDVFGGAGPSFEFAFRSAETTVRRSRAIAPDGAGPPVAHDEDVVCRLDLRARFEPKSLFVRRLSLTGVTDDDPGAGTQPSCEVDEEHPGRVALRASQIQVHLKQDELPVSSGHVTLRAPLPLVNRFVRMGPLSGVLKLAADVRHDGQTRLPELRGTLEGSGVALAGYRLAERLQAELAIEADRVLVPRFYMRFADGDVHLSGARIEPFAEGAPIRVERVDSDGMQFTALMRDLDVTPDTIVNWDLNDTLVSNIEGTLSPLRIDADIRSDTRDFEVFDRAFHDDARRHVIGVKAARVQGRLGVRPDAFLIYDTRATFGKSSVFTKLVSIGFSNELKLEVAEGAKLHLSDITPLLDIPMAGVAKLGRISMTGTGGDVVLNGEIAVDDLNFGGFPIGTIDSSKFRFKPLKVDFTDVRGTKNQSAFVVSTARLNFDTDAAIVADAEVRSDNLNVRDFLHMWHFDGDPRFDDLHGKAATSARVHYALGGREDACGDGTLRVAGRLKAGTLEIFGERYDSANADFDFRWIDPRAGQFGIDLKVPSLSLSKGGGHLLGSLEIRPGAHLGGHFVGTGVPLSRIDALGPKAALVDGHVSAVAEVSGTIDQMRVVAQAQVSKLRVGGSQLPPSELSIRLDPTKSPSNTSGTTKCGRPIPTAFDRAEYDQDRPSGVFHVSGSMFAGQVQLDDLQITRQRSKTSRGRVVFDRLNVGALAELSPAVALAETKPKGMLSGELKLVELNLDNPARAKAELELSKLELSQGQLGLELRENAGAVIIADSAVQFPKLTFAMVAPGGQRGIFDVRGTVADLGRQPTLDARLELRPFDVASLQGTLPRVERLAGRLDGHLKVRGPFGALRYEGGFRLRDAEVWARGLPTPISDLALTLTLDGDELRLDDGFARIGGGSVRLTARAPVRDFELGTVRAVIAARGLHLPLKNGIKSQADADLVVTYDPNQTEKLPQVDGSVLLKGFEYSRPVMMTADIASLAQRGRRTEFESYDPSDDTLEFDVTVKSDRPLAIRNNLVEADLVIDDGGLQLAGTNQRYGMRGALKLKPGGHIRLRRNDFEIRHGQVRFDDLTRVAAQVDVTAVTEYRRYSDVSGGAAATASAPAAPTGTGSSTSATGGRWLVTMHAHGDSDQLKVDLSSEPALPQDDIFLLLTVGLTRAELDQAQSASVGESVALEALGTLTGADRAVTEALPVIDEFRFGSAYSSRTGRTEPTVTIGKRLAERIRANVTSGLAESREIRSNVEWRLSPRVSVQGSYDNVNDISSSSLGNLGADVRWRLEFE